VADDECPICAKHRGAGPLVAPLIWGDEHVVVSHLGLRSADAVHLGYLFVESRRHVPHLDQLRDDEAAAVGRAAARAAAALRAEVDAEHVFSAVIGQGIAHFHQHVFARYRGTPAGVVWTASDEWAGAPRGGLAEVEALCARLRPHLNR
jgi:ATP adenylyltransferase